MVRKFINRQQKKGLDAKKEVSAEDEWAHLSGAEEGIDRTIRTKIDAIDAMEVLDRSITFGKEEETGPKTHLEIVQEEAKNAVNAAGKTGKYIRFVNQHMEKQRHEINKIKQIQEKFDH